MKHTKWKRRLALALSLGLLTGALGGCGKSDEPAGNDSSPSRQSDSAPSEKGRYVEEEIPLPPELAEETALQMFRSGNRLHLLTTRTEGENTALREWELQEEEFQDVTESWLAEMIFPGTDWLEAKRTDGSDGQRYLYAAYLSEDGFLGHLWKAVGSSAVEITPEKWIAPDADTGIFDMVQELAALEDNTLAVSSLFSLELLSGEDGSVLESEAPDSFYDDLLVQGKDLYLLSSDSSGTWIEKRPNAKKSDSVLIPFAPGTEGEASASTGGSSENSFSIGGGGSFFLDILPDGSLIAAEENGIYRLPGGDPESQWELLAEGADTDFSLPDLWCLGLNALEDGSIYALFQSSEAQKLNRYRYDPDAVSAPRQSLTVYSVFENTLLKQAAVLYHKAHPEISIQLQYEYSLDSSEIPDYDSVYKKLNTLLLGDGAPDLLVVDHLNAESYLSRGLLENLEDVIRPLEDSGELLSNITQTYLREDGTRYIVPLEFGLQLALGRDIRSEDMKTLETLAGFLSHAQGSYMGPQTTEELVSLFYPFFCDEIVREKQLDKETLGKYLEYLKAIADNCGLIESHPEGESSYGMFDLVGRAKLAFYPANGFADCLLPMAMAEYIKGDFAAFENRFLPSAQLAICKTCSDPEAAKDFLRFALSLQVQSSDTYRGFPVNRAALEELARKDRSNSILSILLMDEEGGALNFEANPYSAETAERLLQAIEALERPVKEDDKIREVLSECLGDYLRGSRPLEETLSKIEDALKMYLAE
ncbi:MAG: hypothetical protein NC432_00420 [Roseburia sp.]|nr:hypothetical protein [Roseburia sp.]MCM1098349.1 hypothetical protein [Ruminococcus flavefaciens]